ncbi:hypothetical protein RND81_13G111100 [Saponaria officinalis]|uniref:Uncharacterized protein n=1 Tax=Saponaria officinalis TaxID=3572 RepID=A0AAW1H026_SAPOF
MTTTKSPKFETHIFPKPSTITTMSCSTTEKRCYYEVLGLPQSCNPDEIRSAYRKLALQRHPDKLIQSGLSSSEATSSFQELVRAYEVLSDPKERSWYDSHRSQILYSPISQNNSSNGGGGGDDVVPDLFSYFSASCYTDYKDEEKGFYRVYGDVFERVYRNEVNYCRKLGLGLGLVKEAPLMGDLGSDYGQVSAFYGYWLGFTTVMDFGWVDKWDAMAGENRRARRVMEEENKKVRKKARREFNDTVRGLAEFVKKRDKRVIDMSVLREKEREKKRVEEARKKKEREREKLEKARAFQEPDWTRVDEELIVDDDEENVDEDEEKRELYCAACGKKFKSDKQWMNHEKSKKHRERVAELRRVFEKEDCRFEGGDDTDNANDDDNDNDDEGDNVGELRVEEDVGVDDGFVSAEDDDDDDKDEDELSEKFKECVEVDEEKDEDGVGNVEESSKTGQPVVGSDGEDASILEAMNFGRRRGKHVTFMDQTVEKDEDEVEAMEYNNKKGKKKSRRANKKDKGKAFDGLNESGENSKTSGGSNVASDGDDDDGNHDRQARPKGGKKGSDRKSKRDVESKPKSSTSRGRKQKDKDADPVCEKCGEEFDSRNKLYKHLSDTGHASLKSR